MIAVSGLSLLPASARRPGLITKAVSLVLGKTVGEVNVVIVDRKRMLKLNKEFLGHSHDTDVIAFDYDGAPEGADSPFGDVFISAHQARVQAKELGHPVLEEVLTLAIHGALHLLGHDDHSAKGKKRMFELQDEVLAKVLARR